MSEKSLCECHSTQQIESTCKNVHKCRCETHKAQTMNMHSITFLYLKNAFASTHNKKRICKEILAKFYFEKISASPSESALVVFNLLSLVVLKPRLHSTLGLNVPKTRSGNKKQNFRRYDNWNIFRQIAESI